MVGGVDILFFRPDDELRKLARLALELGLADAIIGNEDPDAVLAAIAAAPERRAVAGGVRGGQGAVVLVLDRAGLLPPAPRLDRRPDGCPFSAMRGYIEKLRAGENIDRPLDKILRRARADRPASTASCCRPTTTARRSRQCSSWRAQVYPFVENHNFYVEHWHHSIFWNKVRELGACSSTDGFLDDAEDIFYLHRYEVHQALYDMLTGWATTQPGARRATGADEIAERKRIMDRLRAVGAAAGARRSRRRR